MNFAIFGIDCLGLSLLMLPLVLLAFLPFLIVWAAHRDAARLWGK